MLKQRIITALILFILLLAALFLLPQIGWAVLVLGIVLVGAYEWGRLAQLDKRGTLIYWWCTLVLMATLIYFNQREDHLSQWLSLLIDGMASAFWLLVVPLWLKGGWQLRRPLLMALIGWLVLLPTGLAMIDLRAIGPWWLLGVMMLVWMADVAAYFAGRRFGKHKLAPSVSPGKTWEGVGGAVLGVSLYVVLADWGSGLSGGFAYVPVVILVSWLGVAMAILGDLFESAVKRQAGVKDSGALLPGHGGLLDRIDALTSTLPVAALVLLLKGMV